LLGYRRNDGGFEYWLGQEILLFFKSARQALGPTQPSTQWVWQAQQLITQWVWQAQQLITHLHQVSSLMMVEIIPALPLYAFMACIKLYLFC